MSSGRSRIGVVAVLLTAGFAVVLLHLWFLMVHEQEAWARRSFENRWAFRSVPSQRGALLDRHGRPLAHDDATSKLSLYYLRFRLRHIVGSAVHGAIRWAELQPGREGTVYGYRDGALGPLAAARDLLGVPVRALRRGQLPKQQTAALMRYATTVLSGCSGWSRRRVYSALRSAAQAGALVGIGDVLTMPRRELLSVYEQRVASLRQLDARIAGEQQRRAAAIGIHADELPGLIDTLEFLRRASLQQTRVTWQEDGKTRQGSLLENVRRVFAEDVSFEIAAALRIDGQQHPGIEVAPAVSRVHDEPPRSALRVLLGNVRSLDRALPDNEWFDRHADRELPPDWLDELVPPGLVETPDARERLQADAKRRYSRALLLRERRGITGCESSFDAELMGRLGMRFVEHDSKRREQRLWSHLQVERGNDVRLTLDVDLQHAAEAATARAIAVRERYSDDADRKRVEAALAVIDALTGDVLAYGGSPIVSGNARDVPGVVWLGNGSVGSVLKPFVLVEHLNSEAAGRPHRPSADIEPCSGRFRFGGRTLRCDHDHWDEGRDPVRAIAKSCNLFFYQVGLGLENDGWARALRRFGLLEPSGDDDPFAACWQTSIVGLAAARPKSDRRRLLPMRSIGYGVEASPVHVARAYAGLATGRLPKLGLRFDESRPHVELPGIERELEIVRDGLRQCVASGTARRLELLDELSVHGKTGTAEVGRGGQNNAWFAGYLPWPSQDGAQLCFCAVVYWVPDKVHGGDAAGQLVVDFLSALQGNPTLHARYLTPAEGR